MRVALAVLALVCISACTMPPQSVTEAPVSATDADLETLAQWMTGSFSSAEQAAADVDYFDIRLEMVRIWTDRTDGYWFYVEQAAASALDKPYRQRVYHVTTQEDGSFSSAVYAFPEPLAHAGAWKTEDPLADVTRESLEEKTGCAVILRKTVEGHFTGGTVENGCLNTLRGAVYATAEVTVKSDRILSWDRGFDKDGNQIWGAEKGGYIFLKTTP